MRPGSFRTAAAAFAAVLALAGASLLVPAIALGTGPYTTAMSTTIRNQAGSVITQVEYDKTEFHVHVVLAGDGIHATPTGTVTVFFYWSTDCTGVQHQDGPPIGLVNGVANTPSEWTSAPTLSFKAKYSGDLLYGPRTSLCKPLAVIKQKPVVKTVVRDANGVAGTVFPIGMAVHDSGTVTGVNAVPTDSTYDTYYSDGACTNPVDPVTVGFLSNGAFDDVLSRRTFTKPGTHSFRSEYKGDAHFQDVLGACEPFTIKAPPTIRTKVRDGTTFETTIHINTGKIADQITLSGDFGTPTGTVFVQVFGNSTCSGMPIEQSGKVTLAGGIGDVLALDGHPLPQPGNYAFEAFYSGDGKYLRGTGTCEPFTLVRSFVDTALDLFDADGAFIVQPSVGAAFHLEIRETGFAGTPTGTIHATYLGSGCTGLGAAVTATLAGGKAVFPQLTPSQAGDYAIGLSYSGDASYTPWTYCWPYTVIAAGATPDPAATPAPVAVAAPTPGATEQPIASASPTASPAASETASVAPSASEEPSTIASPASTAGPAASAPPASASGPDPTILAVGVLLLVLVLLGVLLAVGRRRRTAG